MPSPISSETVTRRVLRNGLTVLVMENHSNPAVTVRGRMSAGGLRDPGKSAGLATFTAAALNRGTRRYSFRQLNEEFDRLGLSFGVGAGLESAGFGGKSLAEDFDRLLGIASEILLRPVFPNKEIEKLRSELVADLRESNDDTREVAYKEFRKLCYPVPHPYHRLPEGTESSLRRIRQEDLERFHARYYDPSLCIFVIVGDVHAEDAFASLEEHFGGWKNQPVRGLPEIQPPPLRSAPAFKEVQLAGKTQADIVIGYPGLRRSDPEYYALLVGDLIFGRMGLSGRIGANVRDKMGLAYYAYSSFEAGLGAGPWTVSAGVNPKNIQPARDAIMDEIERFRTEGVTQEELDEAKDFLTGFLALRLETNDGLAASLTDIEFYRLGLDYVERYPSIIRGVTREQVQTVAARYAHPETAVTVVAAPKAK